MERYIGVLGLVAMVAIAWALSSHRKQFPWRVVLSGLVLQLALALVILRTDGGRYFFEGAKNAIGSLISLSDEGAAFVFGQGFSEHFVAFKVLPTIIFVSSLSYVLFYFGILQRVVSGMAWLMYRTMGISGSESLCTAANVFIGQTEAPLVIKPYLSTMTRSEIMCMMTGGMATVAGGVLAAYVGFGVSAGHLLAASLMSAPAAVLIAKVMVPETEVSPTQGEVQLNLEIPEVNAFEAACKGASDGLMLALNVGAMLIAFIALVALVNLILGHVAGIFGCQVTFEQLLGYVMAPFAFLMGIPWEDCLSIGELLGEKMVVNEFLAYQHLGEISRGESQNALGEIISISERSKTIATYALCGFANFSSVAIQIGGIGSLAPDRRSDFARLGLRSMIGGTLAAFMTACIAGLLI